MSTAVSSALSVIISLPNCRVCRRRAMFLTPMSFLISTARNARQMVDKVALGLGLISGRCGGQSGPDST